MKTADVKTEIVLTLACDFRSFHDLPTRLEREFGVPFKVGLRAVEREIRRGFLDSGVTDRRPFLTVAGQKWLLENTAAGPAQRPK